MRKGEESSNLQVKKQRLLSCRRRRKLLQRTPNIAEKYCVNQLEQHREPGFTNNLHTQIAFGANKLPRTKLRKRMPSLRAIVPALLFSPTSSSSPPEEGEETLEIAVSEEDLMASSSNTSPSTLSHGIISVIGRRRSMEDAVTVVPSFVDVPWGEDGVGSLSYDFFAVYDGHGGNGVSQKCKERLHHLIAEEVSKSSGHVEWGQAMRTCFARMDDEVGSNLGGTDTGAAVVEEREQQATVGSTAVVVLVSKEELVVANCGDCRVVLCRGGTALPLSRDHKPERPDEKERVEAAGGNVVNWDTSRVLGVLSTSRSIGDHYLKPYVTSEPEVEVYKGTESDEFLVIASDGLWDVVSNEVACELVRKCLDGDVRQKVLEGVRGNCAAGAATMLAELALARGSRDNISIIVAELRK